mgnify:CR=1 FL=1
MILINLLPHRALARKRRRQAFRLALAGAALGGLLACAGMDLAYRQQIEAQQARNARLASEIEALNARIADIARIAQEIAALRVRQKAVEDLQADRNLPVQLLNQLALQLPEGIYLESVKQAGPTVQIRGVAQSSERVSQLLHRLAGGTPWLSRPELVEVVEVEKGAARAGFSLRLQLLRSGESGPHGDAALRKADAHG